MTPEDEQAVGVASSQSTDQVKPHCHMADLSRHYIAQGRLHGYLTFHEGVVVGWCNAGDREDYEQPEGSSEIGDFILKHLSDRTKAAACFLIDPKHRGQGVASALLDRVVADARSEGYLAVEGYPRPHEGYDPFDDTGPTVLYAKAGFTCVAEGPGVNIMRLTLSD